MSIKKEELSDLIKKCAKSKDKDISEIISYIQKNEPNIKHLYLSGCELNTEHLPIISKILKAFPAIEMLNLNYNRIDNIDKFDVGKNLKTLFINRNEIKAIDNFDVKNLHTLHASRNPIDNIDKFDVKNLQKFVILNDKIDLDKGEDNNTESFNIKNNYFLTELAVGCYIPDHIEEALERNKSNIKNSEKIIDKIVRGQKKNTNKEDVKEESDNDYKYKIQNQDKKLITFLKEIDDKKLMSRIKFKNNNNIIINTNDPNEAHSIVEEIIFYITTTQTTKTRTKKDKSTEEITITETLYDVAKKSEIEKNKNKYDIKAIDKDSNNKKSYNKSNEDEYLNVWKTKDCNGNDLKTNSSNRANFYNKVKDTMKNIDKDIKLNNIKPMGTEIGKPQTIPLDIAKNIKDFTK